MKKNTRTFLKYSTLILIILLVGGGIYIKNIKKPILVNQVYEPGILVKSDSRESIESNNINISINGKVNKGVFIPEERDFLKLLEGELKVNNESYKVELSNTGSGTDYLYWGNAFQLNNKGDHIYHYSVYISEDLEKIFLIDTNNNDYIASPANTVDDLYRIKQMNRYNENDQ